LIRSIYGRGGDVAAPVGWLTKLIAHLVAERGYHVIMQTTRGRFDCEGKSTPFLDERDDGRATIEWITRQPWFDGRLGMMGASYNAYSQWAAAADAPPALKAIVPFMTTTNVFDLAFPDGAFGMDLTLRWLRLVDVMEQPNRYAARREMAPSAIERALQPVFKHLPMGELDVQAVGHEIDYFQHWLRLPDREAPAWKAVDLRDLPAKVTIPVHFIGGWYDFMLRGLLADYAAMRAAGRTPHLTIGPWEHTSGIAMAVSIRESLTWMDAHLKGESHRQRKKRVRIFVMGAKQWREIDDWPPPSQPTRYYLREGRRLSVDLPNADEAPDHYRYDPANPTPSVGGALLLPPSGPVDNRELESRPDVLTYTTPVLTRPVEIMGEVKLELYACSSLPHTDFFGRLCDVFPDGRSINICDGLFRVEPEKRLQQPDGNLKLEIGLWATANRFQSGHRIRLQVSSGSHPRWMRNLGTDEPMDTATRMLSADQTILHDAAHPSALVLPVTN